MKPVMTKIPRTVEYSIKDRQLVEVVFKGDPSYLIEIEEMVKSELIPSDESEVCEGTGTNELTCRVDNRTIAESLIDTIGRSIKLKMVK